MLVLNKGKGAAGLRGPCHIGRARGRTFASALGVGVVEGKLDSGPIVSGVVVVSSLGVGILEKRIGPGSKDSGTKRTGLTDGSAMKLCLVR